jgi:hypothetical protein
MEISYEKANSLSQRYRYFDALTQPEASATACSCETVWITVFPEAGLL